MGWRTVILEDVTAIEATPEMVGEKEEPNQVASCRWERIAVNVSMQYFTMMSNYIATKVKCLFHRIELAVSIC